MSGNVTGNPAPALPVVSFSIALQYVCWIVGEELGVGSRKPYCVSQPPYPLKVVFTLSVPLGTVALIGIDTT
jgi:hypothetical protein